MASLNLLTCKIYNLEHTSIYNIASVDVIDERVQLLEYKTIELEARQRECNLYIGGVAEAFGEDCWQLVNSVFTTDLQLREEDFTIVNTYRVGNKFADRDRSRLIFVTFAHPGHVNDSVTLLRLQTLGKKG